MQSERQRSIMPVQLPQEMINQITEYFHTDIESLLECCLISRAWVGAAQIHIFRTIHLSTVKQIQAFSRLLKTSSHIAQYVRDLTILPEALEPGQRYFMVALLSVAPKLVNLNRLKFRPSDDSVAHKNLAVVNLSSSIHTLVLSDFTFSTYHDFVKMLRAHPRLTELQLRSTRIKDPSDITTSISPCLEEIKISTLFVSYFDRQPHVFNKIMHDVSRSITHLGMGPRADGPGDISTIRIHPCTSLCALSFVLTFGTILRDHNWPVKMLSQVTSKSVRKVTFHLPHRHVHQYHRPLDWKGVKDVLSRNPFVSLKQIIISHPGNISTNEEQLWLEEIRREMKGLDEGVSIILETTRASDW